MSNPLARRRPPLSALLIDISGTLHIGSTPTLHAVEAFRELQRSSYPFRLCSNTSKESTSSLVKRLDGLGFGITEAEKDKDSAILSRRLVWTSIAAVAQVIKDMGLRTPFLMLSDSAREEVLTAMNKRDKINPPQPSVSTIYDSVVVGLAPSVFDYANLTTAFRILKGEPALSYAEKTPTLSDSLGTRIEANTAAASGHQAPLIATHKAKYVQTESGLSLGPGPFVTALESAAGVRAHVIGKPTKAFFQMVIQDFTEIELASGPESEVKREPRFKSRIAVIGDDVEADLGEGAVELGLWRILVKTGKYRPRDETRPGVVPPDEVFDSFAAFINSLLTETEYEGGGDS